MKHFVDEDSNKHFLVSELARGGQGVVWRTKDADVAVKEAVKEALNLGASAELEQFRKKIKRLIFKPLDGVRVTKPLVLLEGRAGYVMELLSQMSPIKTLDPKSAGKFEKEEFDEFENSQNEFVKSTYEALDDKEQKLTSGCLLFYIRSGGVRHRLKVLTNVARELAKLYARGLVYCDISLENIFVSESGEVFLIDPDNIEYASQTKSRMQTPGFEVPEVIDEKKCEPNSIQSDLFAFAILAYRLLTFCHPFSDGKAESGEDWGDDEQKPAWLLPWIEDVKDSSNESGFAKDFSSRVLSGELKRLFHVVFEDGKFDKFARVGADVWAKNLALAWAKTLLCEACGMSYFDDAGDICPFCDAPKPKRLVVESWCGGKSFALFTRELFDGKSVSVPAFVSSFDGVDFDDEFCTAKLNVKKNCVEFDFGERFEFAEFSLKNKKFRLSELENGVVFHTKNGEFELKVSVKR